MEFLSTVSDWVVGTSQAHPWLAPLAVFAGGVISVINPCSLASLPLMMGYVLSQGGKSWKNSILMSTAFVAGFAAVFAAVGVAGVVLKSAAAKAFIAFDLSLYGSYLVGIVLLAAGAWFMGLINIPLPEANVAGFSRKGLTGALILGMIFALTTGPCSGPIFAAVLTLVKGRVAYQALLMFAYALGGGVVVLAAGASAGAVQKVTSSKGFTKANATLKVAGGLIFVLLGLYFLLVRETTAGIVLTILAAAGIGLAALWPRLREQGGSSGDGSTGA